MKEIKAFVKPFKVNDILNQLMEAGFPNITVSLDEGTGTFQSEETTLSTHYSFTNSKVAKLEIVSNDNDVDGIIDIISKAGKTGNPGDGIIFISNVENLFKVKTGCNIEL